MSGPRRRMLRQRPEKGSPVVKVVRRISPTRGQSGLEGEKRRVRAPVGSRVWMWDSLMAEMGKGCCFAVEAGGG